MPPLLGSEPIVVGLAAALLIALALMIAAALGRRRFKATVEREVRSLRAAHAATRKALQAAEEKIAAVQHELSAKTEAQERKVARELQMLESLMRDLGAKTSPRAAQTITGAERRLAGQASYVSRPQASSLLDIVKGALEDNRVDLYLQPVVSLPQRKVRFYEALSRLRSEDGTVIMPGQYIKVAAPAGLMSVIDNLLLFRCVQVVKRLAARSRDIAIFCNISEATLADAEFFPQFLDFMKSHRELARQIVFEFPQSAILRADAAEQDRLRRLSALGFRLSMDQVTRLDTDFGPLKRLGFHFVKLGAPTLMSGMAGARAKVAAEDFKALLQRDGLSLIAERIEDEKTVLHLLDCSVDFGQGYLFGEPRPVRDLGDPQEARPRAPAQAAANPLSGAPRRVAG